MSLRAALAVVSQVAKTAVLPAATKLLSRDTFIAAVKQRTLGFCALCDKKADEAHQIMDRRLFPDDGYYMGNGIALCDLHHKMAEATLISVEALRHKINMTETPILPPNFRADVRYDKWGNIVVNSSMIILGPLKTETAMHRALLAAKKGSILYEAMPFMISVIPEAPTAVSKHAQSITAAARRERAEMIKAERAAAKTVSMPLDIIL